MIETSPVAAAHPLAFWRWKLHWQIFLGLLIGAALGLLTGNLTLAATPPGATPEAIRVMLRSRGDYRSYELLADLFMNGLRLIVVPLVMSSLISAVASFGHGADFARMGVKIIAYYLFTSTLAVLLALALVNAIKPGVVDPSKPVLNIENTKAFSAEAQTIASQTVGKSTSNILDTFRQVVPSNFFAAAANDQLLGIIFVSLLTGFFITRLAARHREVLTGFAQAVAALSFLVTEFILRFAPLGVAALLAKTLADNYATLALDQRLSHFLQIIVMFFLTVLLALAIHFFVILPGTLFALTRLNPVRQYKAVLPALMTAFSTASSAACLPVNMECLEKRAGVSNRVSSFVLSLGANINMDGTALYECAAAMFIAQAYGIHLSFTQQFVVVFLTLLTSMGIAGVPAASLVAIVIILRGVGVPIEGLAIILVVDRILDMCRTTVNVFSDTCITTIIAKTEGESPLANPALLRG